MNTINVAQIKEIYQLLQDDISKDIFENRLMFSLTEDYKYIRKVTCSVENIKKMYVQLKKTSEKIGIFGAGDVARYLIKTYSDIKFQCFIDNTKAGTIYENLEVISLQDFKETYPDGYIVISTKIYHGEIYNQLIAEGWCEEKIINVGKEYDILSHYQYFDLPYLGNSEKEVFVDGGCYDGNTTLDFKEWCKNKGIKDSFVYAREPDLKNIVKCEKRFSEKELNYSLITKGLWNKKDSLQFNMNDTASSICESGGVMIEVDSIDNICKIIPTFIKMDIEGAEYKALLGAREIISQYKPKLAICVYHKPEDIWELPVLIHEMNSDYKFYLRHYSFADNETVLYAI